MIHTVCIDFLLLFLHKKTVFKVCVFIIPGRQYLHKDISKSYLRISP